MKSRKEAAATSSLALAPRHPAGREYLELVSRLLQDARLAEPEGGLWDAADLQWWWRIDQHVDPNAQSIWTEGNRPSLAVVFSQWRDWVGCDLLGTDAAVAEHSDVLWGQASKQFTSQRVEMIIRDDDRTRIAAAERSGFVAGEAEFATGWMDVGDRPISSVLPAGMRISSYEDGRHPMATRNGDGVGKRLAEAPLYRSDLDLALFDGEELAGYALFWADPVTRVGLLEPMRIEDAYQGRGLSKVLIAAGLDRLAAAGCSRLKVTYGTGNEAAVRLYARAGYRVRSTAHSWARAPGI